MGWLPDRVRGGIGLRYTRSGHVRVWRGGGGAGGMAGATAMVIIVLGTGQAGLAWVLEVCPVGR